MTRKTVWGVLVCALLVGGLAAAGTITGFKDKFEVRQITMTAIEQWLSDPTGATACGGGSCCPDTFANAQCTAAGLPIACCTGAGTGTCNELACSDFALELQLDPSGWADDVEVQYQFDADWLCNSFPDEYNSNRIETVCTTTQGTPIIDVARILSEIAGRRNSP